MSDVNLAELAALIRTKRGNRGLQAAAKEIGGISASTLSRIERGHVPDLNTFLRLCRWLGVSPDHLAHNLSVSSEPQKAAATDVDIITAHLRAQRTLDPKTVEALVTMIRLAFEAAGRGDWPQPSPR